MDSQHRQVNDPRQLADNTACVFIHSGKQAAERMSHLISSCPWNIVLRQFYYCGWIAAEFKHSVVDFVR